MDAVTILLIRHGETHGYFGDVGLTEVGEAQARAKGAELAATLEPGTPVVLRHAPTARGTATAEVMRAALVEALGGDDGISETLPDGRFDSMQFLLDGTAVESTNAAAARREWPAEDRVPDWVAEYDRFDSDQGPSSRAGGPIDRWLVSATRYFEPPQVATYRLWAGITGLAEEMTGELGDARTAYVVSHSGPMRAFAAVAFGSDQGEPANLAHVAIRFVPGQPSAEITYDGRTVLVDVPDRLPPWIDRAYLDGKRDGSPF